MLKDITGSDFKGPSLAPSSIQQRIIFFTDGGSGLLLLSLLNTSNPKASNLPVRGKGGKRLLILICPLLPPYEFLSSGFHSVGM